MKKIHQSKYEFRITQIVQDKITNIKYKFTSVIDWWLADLFYSQVSSVNKWNSWKDASGRKFYITNGCI